MLVSVFTYEWILPTNMLLPRFKFESISIAYAAKNAMERWTPTLILVLIALGVIANKDHLLLPKIYGLNAFNFSVSWCKQALPLPSLMSGWIEAVLGKRPLLSGRALHKPSMASVFAVLKDKWLLPRLLARYISIAI